MAKKKIVSSAELEVEFKTILASFDTYPAIQTALCRAKQIGSFLGQIVFMGINDNEQLELTITDGNEIADVKVIPANQKEQIDG